MWDSRIMPVLALALAGSRAPPVRRGPPTTPRPSRPSAASARRRWSSPTRSRNRHLPALSAREAIDIARTSEVVREELAETPDARPQALIRGDRWQVNYFDPRDEGRRADRRRDPGEIDEAWRDYQVETGLARGYDGAIAQTVNAPIWLPLCLLFLALFFDPRRPLRLVHLDLLVILGLSLSLLFFNRAEITTSVALTYPVLGYLLLRMLVAGLRPRERPGPLLPWAPVRWLAVGVVVLAAARMALNVIDSQVIDIGVAGVIGADRIADGAALYEGHFADIAGLRGRLRAGQLPGLSVRAGLRLGRRLGRRPGRARRGDRLRSALRRRARRPGPAAAGRRGAGARLGSRLRLGLLPVDALRHERERQRRARRGVLDRSPARVALAARPRGLDRPRGGREVRLRGVGALVRDRRRRAALARIADLPHSRSRRWRSR